VNLDEQVAKSNYCNSAYELDIERDVTEAKAIEESAHAIIEGKYENTR